MPDEFSRTTARKTIVLPGGDKIKVPVITRISFVDPYDRYQETEHSLDNTSESNRIAHVDKVHAVDVDEDGISTSESVASDTSETLYVERIDTWNAADPYDRYQETQLTLDNVTGNDQTPPHFSNHVKTHIYRYHQDPQNPDDHGVWIDSELIDEFSVIDPYDRDQETHYNLDNPTNADLRAGDVSGQASASDPDITIGDGSGEGTVDNPVRLDPFQNIVNFSGGLYVMVIFTWTDGGWSNYPEECIQQGEIGSQTHHLEGGTEAEVIPPSITVQWNETASKGAEVINYSDTTSSDDPDIATQDGTAHGYEMFGPCQPCEFSFSEIETPNGCDADDESQPGTTKRYFTDGVPVKSYSKTFLFSATPTKSGSAALPSEIVFDLSGIPGSGDYLKVIKTIPTIGGFPHEQIVTRTTVGFRVDAYVFSSSRVDIYSEDASFPRIPLRAKEIDPTAPTAVQQTLDQYKTETFKDPIGAYVDEDQILHEAFDSVSQIKLRFETFTMSDGEDSALVWPKVPTAFDTGGPDSQRIPRYTYRAKRPLPAVPIKPDHSPDHDSYIDFGVSPP